MANNVNYEFRVDNILYQHIAYTYKKDLKFLDKTNKAYFIKDLIN